MRLEVEQKLPVAFSKASDSSRNRIIIDTLFLLIRIVLLPSALCYCYTVAAKRLAQLFLVQQIV